METADDDPNQSEKASQPASVEITARAKGVPPTEPWSVIARDKKVRKGWEQLVRNTSANAINCYDWLVRHPMKPMPGRCYPLKGKEFAGHWCYEVGAGDRVYYQPDPASKKVTVWYAGPHPSAIPVPPSLT